MEVNLLHLLVLLVGTYQPTSIMASTEEVLNLRLKASPVLINTWNFLEANVDGWQVLSLGGSALTAVEEGCTRCEDLQCDGTVGYGGSPDEEGETTLDAMIMDGNSLNVGAVGCLRRIKPAMRVARKVLEHTRHTLLVGEKATRFAMAMGFREESLSTEESTAMWREWRENGCQPNFWQATPGSGSVCGPYNTTGSEEELLQRSFDPQVHGNTVQWGEKNHDTIGMLALDSEGNVAAGTSTNGARFKIAGRVGDSPIPGAGAYADSEVGAAAATGDGDVMMRVLPSLLAVEAMRSGASPEEAAHQVIVRIARKFPDFMGAVVTLNRTGEVGAACHGIPTFPYIVATADTGGSVKREVSCVNLEELE